MPAIFISYQLLSAVRSHIELRACVCGSSISPREKISCYLRVRALDDDINTAGQACLQRRDRKVRNPCIKPVQVRALNFIVSHLRDKVKAVIKNV